MCLYCTLRELGSQRHREKRDIAQNLQRFWFTLIGYPLALSLRGGCYTVDAFSNAVSLPCSTVVVLVSHFPSCGRRRRRNQIERCHRLDRVFSSRRRRRRQHSSDNGSRGGGGGRSQQRDERKRAWNCVMSAKVLREDNLILVKHVSVRQKFHPSKLI